MLNYLGQRIEKAEWENVNQYLCDFQIVLGVNERHYLRSVHYQLKLTRVDLITIMQGLGNVSVSRLRRKMCFMKRKTKSSMCIRIDSKRRWKVMFFVGRSIQKNKRFDGVVHIGPLNRLRW